MRKISRFFSGLFVAVTLVFSVVGDANAATITCSAGQYCYYRRQATCTACEAGYYCPGGSVSCSLNSTIGGRYACSALTPAPGVTGGTYTSAASSSAATACKYTAPAATESPVACGATPTPIQVTWTGSAWPTKLYNVNAKAGAYVSSAIGNNCAYCPQGSYTASAGNQTSCTPCQNGTTTSGTGQTSCNADCINKNDYTYGWNTVTWNSLTNSVVGVCSPSGCIKGAYALQINNNQCAPCAAGMYQATANSLATSCTNLPAGYYNTGCGTSSTGGVCSVTDGGLILYKGSRVNPGYYSTGGGTSATPTANGAGNGSNGCRSGYNCGKVNAEYFSTGGGTSATPVQTNNGCITGQSCGACAEHASSVAGSAYCTCDNGYVIGGGTNTATYSTNDRWGNTCAARTYTITYKTGNTVIGTQTCNYGDTVTPLTESQLTNVPSAIDPSLWDGVAWASTYNTTSGSTNNFTCSGDMTKYAVWGRKLLLTWFVSADATSPTTDWSDPQYYYNTTATTASVTNVSTYPLYMLAYHDSGWVPVGWALNDTTYNATVVASQTGATPTTVAPAANVAPHYYAIYHRTPQIIYNKGSGTGGSTADSYCTEQRLNSANPDGSVSSSDCTLSASGFTAPSGYSFAYWVDSGANGQYSAGGSYDFSREWNSPNYETMTAMYSTTITLNKNSGSGTINGTSGTGNASKICYYGSSCSFGSAAGLSQTGYTFTGGWGTSSSCTGTTTSFTNPTGTYYACKTADSYTISYTLNSGTQATSGVPTSYTYGTGATINGIPTRSGYTFAGWCTDSGLTSCAMSQTISTTATGNKTFYAKWTQCTACAATGGATCSLSVVNNACTYTTSCPSAVTSAGYSIVNNGAYNPYCRTQCSAGNAVLTANAACAVVTGNRYQTGNHYVTYDNTTPTASDTASPSVGKVYSCPTNYTISGTAATNHDARSDCQRSITLNKNGGSGSVSASVTCSAGAACTLPDASGLTQTGYTFGGGWSTSSGAGATGCTNSVNTPSAGTYYACKTANNYTLTVVAGNGVKSIQGDSNWTNNANLTQSTRTLSYGFQFSLDELTMALKPGYQGYTYTVTSGNATVASDGKVTMGAGDSTITINAATLISPKTMGVTPSITGGTTKTYNYQATTLTASYSPTNAYDSGVHMEYKFGYTPTSTSTTCSGTVTYGTQTATATLSVAKDEFLGYRCYKIQMVATDGILTSEGAESGWTTMGLIQNAITFNATQNSGTLSGTSPLYQRYNVANLYTTATGTTTATVPTASKTGNNVWTGWYTAASGGSQIYNASNTLSSTAVSGWISGSKWVATGAKTLYAQYGACGCTKGSNVSECTVTGVSNNKCQYSYTCNSGYHVGSSGTTATGTFEGVVGTATNTSPACNANTITLNWDENGGGAINNGSCTYGGNLVLPSAPTRTGYTFAGWKTAANETAGNYRAAGSTITGGCTSTYTGVTSGTSTAIQAQWTANCNAITLDNTTRGGSTSNKTLYKYTDNPAWYSSRSNATTCATAVTTTAAPSKTNASFSGYYTSATNTTTSVGSSASPSVLSTTWTVTGPTTVYAHYNCASTHNQGGTDIAGACNANTYTITYELNGGTQASSGVPTSYTYGVGATINGTPTRAHSSFDGWCTDSGLTSCSATQTISTTATGNKTFYANWSCDTGYHADGNSCVANTCTVAFKTGNTSLGTQSFTYGTAQNLTTLANLSNVPTALTSSTNGWSFQGWSTGADANREYTDGQSLSTLCTTNGATITLYGVWSRSIPFKYYNSATATSITTSNRTQSYYNTSASAASANSVSTYALYTSTQASSGWAPLGWATSTSATSASVAQTGATTTTVTPAYNAAAPTYYAVYSRTPEIAYAGNGHSGSMSNSTCSAQTYNAGGTAGSSSSCTLATNGFTMETGCSFNKWAAGSATGTQYAAGASYAFPNTAWASNKTYSSMYAYANAGTGYSNTDGGVCSVNNYTITVNAGAGVSTVAATGWTNTGTASMSKSFDYGATINLPNTVTPTHKNGYTGTSYAVTSGNCTINASNVVTVGAGACEITVNATGITAPTAVTISNGTSGVKTETFNYQAVPLTTSVTTPTYDSDISLMYQFEYTNYSNAACGTSYTNVGSASTTSTYSVSKSAYRGYRCYNVKVYATDGTLTSSTIEADPATVVRFVQRRVIFNVDTDSGETISSGTSPLTLYSRYNTNTLYTSQTGSTQATIPTATKTGCAFNGWWTAASGGNQVLSASNVLTSATISGYTASSTWRNTSDKNVYAQFNCMNVSAPDKILIYNGSAQSCANVTVTSPSGATVEYSTSENGTYSGTAPTMTNVSESPITVYYKVSATGYTDMMGSYTCTMNKADCTLGFNETSGSTPYGTNKTFTVTSNPSGGTLTVSPTATGTGINATASISGTTVTMTPRAVGNQTITVTSAATSNYNSCSKNYTLTVSKGNCTVNLSATSGTITYPTANTTFTASSTSGGTLTVSPTATGSGIHATAAISNGTVTVTPQSAGTQTITVSSAATTNYNACSATYTATVNAKTITLKKNNGSGTCGGVTGTADGSMTCTYGGTCTAPSWNSSTCNITNGVKIFDGWATSASGAVAYAPNADLTNAPTTLYAHWNTCMACNAGTGASCELSVVNNTCTYTTSCLSGYSNITGNGTATPSCTPNTYTVNYALNGGNTLPQGYERLEYIESTGTQYIELPDYFNADTEVEAEMSFNTITSPVAIWGVMSGTNTYYCFRISSNSAQGPIFGTAGLQVALASYVQTGTKYKFKQNKNGVYIDSTLYAYDTGTVSDFTTVREFWLLGAKSSSTSNKVDGRLYSAVVRQSGVIKYNLIPCKNASGVVGMYDTVSGQFFTNAGSGTFTAGPAFTNSTTETYDVNFVVPNPTHPHGTFAGWNITGMESGVTHTLGSTTNTATSASNITATNFKNLRATSGTVTYTATWTCDTGYSGADCSASTYNVTYSCGNGSGTAPTTPNSATYDAGFTPAANSCSRTGYTFTGWKVSGTNDIKAASTEFTWQYTENKTLTAQWAPNTDTVYKVYHYTKGLTGSAYTQNGSVDNLTGTSDASVTLSTLTRNITGFTYDKGFAGTAAAGTTMPAANTAVTTTTILPDGTRVISLYYNRNGYTITLNKNGGSGKVGNDTTVNSNPATITCTYGDTVTLPAYNSTTQLTKGTGATSAIFRGWADNNDCTATTCAYTGVECTGDKTVYAVWIVPTCAAGTGVGATSLNSVSGNAPVCNKTASNGNYCTSGTQTGTAGATSLTVTCTACPAVDSGYSYVSGTGWTSYSQCQETKGGANCASGALTRTASSASAWGNVVSTLTAPAGSYVNGESCSLCATGSYTATAGTQTSCTMCTGGTTTNGTGQTSCNATCVNNNNYDHAWATPTWNNNNPTNICTVSSCKKGSHYATSYTPVNYTTATGTSVQNGTPTPTNPIEPQFYRQGNIVLRKVGDYADSYNATTGQITRRVGVKVLDGTEDWELQNANRSVFVIKTLFPADFASNPDNNIGLCTHFTVTARSTTVSNALENGQMGWNTLGYLAMRHVASLAEVANFKQYLADQYAAGTPVTVYYPLATEVIETLTDTSYTSYANYCEECVGATYQATDGSVATACTACAAGYDYNTDNGKTAASMCQTNCAGGSTVITANQSCADVGVGYWSAGGVVNYGSTGTRTACPTGLTTTGSGTGADEAGDCGRVLHVGNYSMRLRSNKKTSPSIMFDTDNNGVADLFGNMGTTQRNMSSTSNKKFKVNRGGTTYYIYDDTAVTP